MQDKITEIRKHLDKVQAATLEITGDLFRGANARTMGEKMAALGGDIVAVRSLLDNLSFAVAVAVTPAVKEPAWVTPAAPAAPSVKESLIVAPAAPAAKPEKARKARKVPHAGDPIAQRIYDERRNINLIYARAVRSMNVMEEKAKKAVDAADRERNMRASLAKARDARLENERRMAIEEPEKYAELMRVRCENLKKARAVRDQNVIDRYKNNQ
jgi:hypothetical protein